MADGKPVPGSVYFYAPNKIAPPIFATLFLVATVTHVWQCIRYKSWKITALHPFCALLFTAGFAIRVHDAWDFGNIKTYIVSTLLIYSAPPIVELANYHTLGRILYFVPYCSPLHPGRTLTTFGFLSAIVEVTNAFGVAWLMSPAVGEGRQKLGHGLMKASLIIQLAVMSLFAVIAGIFHRRCVKAGIKTCSTRGPLLTLYASTGLILIRTIYRLVEHFGISRIPANRTDDWDLMSLSPIVRYEWFFWVFEAALMLSNSLLWNVRHPRMYLPQDYHVYVAQDGVTEIVGPGWNDDRPWFMTLIDPFGLMADKKDKPFWEMNGYDNVSLTDPNTGRARRSGNAEPVQTVENEEAPLRVGASAV